MRVIAIVFLVVDLLAANGDARAQDSARQGHESRLELKGAAGYSSFVDDGPLPHFVIGGSARIRIFRGLGLEPELTYMYRSQQDRDFILVPNLIWEFRRKDRVVPYLIGGFGLLHHLERSGNYEMSGDFRVAHFGFGTKIFLNRRLFVAPEVRIGWEPHIRIAGTAGYVLKR
jgi:hypothetical protein